LFRNSVQHFLLKSIREKGKTHDQIVHVLVEIREAFKTIFSDLR